MCSWKKRCLALENLSSTESNQQKRKVSHLANVSPEKSTSYNLSCIFCKLNNHNIYKCTKVKALSNTEKRKFIQTKKLCFNCFGSKHTVEKCTSKGCSICQKRHHTLLHIQENSGQAQDATQSIGAASSNNVNDNPQRSSSYVLTNNTQSKSKESIQDDTENKAVHSAFSESGVQILLATGNVTLITADGKCIQAKALLDNGSQTSFISQELVKKLNYTPYKKNTHISGISNNSVFLNYLVDIVIHSKTEINTKFNVSCAILNKITCSIPQFTVNKNDIPIPENINLANLTFNVPSKIDLLLGSDIYYDIIVPGIITLGNNLPTLQNTHFGWVIAGPISNNYCSSNVSVSLCSHTCNINELIPKFWQLEEITNKHFLSPEDKLCEQMFVDNTKHLQNGSFQVNLPLRSQNEHLKLGDSYVAASKRFYWLEKRFKNDTNLFNRYKSFIDEYISLNHGKYVPLELKNDKLENKYFLPHHCVIREASATTKLRVVFDASMKTTTGYSLNDIMLKGFPVQPELFDILCRFRAFKYVLVTDIEKMYRQIRINPSQVFLQNILWRNHPDEELKCIELQTVTYGTNSAPYLATRCLVELANEQKIHFPLASQIIHTQCYVDDILFGADTLENLLATRSELIEMLESSGFKLHKWCSNSRKFAELFSETKQPSKIDIKLENVSNKVLGLSWNSDSDNFKISVPLLSDSQTPTKRNVLSKISQLFDSYGIYWPSDT